MTATMEIENMATSGVDPLAIPSKHRKTYLRENSGWEKMHAMSSHGQNVNYSGRSCGFYENCVVLPTLSEYSEAKNAGEIYNNVQILVVFC